MNIYIQAKQEEFVRVLEHFKKAIASIRTGRANPNILDSVSVMAYNTRNPLNTLANISVADGNSIVVAPWDKTLLKDIEKGITEADLGLALINEGDKLRLKAAALTEENRKELVKKLNEKMEKARIDLRQVREVIKSAIEKAFVDKDIAEDDKFRFIKDLDEEINQQNEALKTVREAKEKEIMTV